MVCSDVLFAIYHTFPYFIHGARAHTRAFFVVRKSSCALEPLLTPASALALAAAHVRTHLRARAIRPARHSSLQCL